VWLVGFPSEAVIKGQGNDAEGQIADMKVTSGPDQDHSTDQLTDQSVGMPTAGT
jgi:hypothetical protein